MMRGVDILIVVNLKKLLNERRSCAVTNEDQKNADPL